ncbi:hypothetical protein D6827_02875 [Candidatus Parcubacteria bacterium]|nr:MAG: hypothetical protein D6827_02875 [Candidatus Parcubacteria bacterium]
MTTQEINQILEKMREADVIRVDKANMIFSLEVNNAIGSPENCVAYISWEEGGFIYAFEILEEGFDFFEQVEENSFRVKDYNDQDTFIELFKLTPLNFKALVK